MDPITSQPQEQLPIPEHKHFLNKKFIVTFVVLLLLGGSAYAGLWYWQKQIVLQSQQNIFNGCEEKINDSYQNTVPATIESLGSAYTFTLRCNNKTSSIYIADPNGLDQYLNIPVTVNYQYVDYLDQVQCVRAPCGPIHETRIKIISVNKVVVDISTWKTYTNTKYGFEIKYPAEWKVNESIGSTETTINIYKEGIPPFNHFSNETQVSIMPQGLATEGPRGESRKVNLDLTQAQEKLASDFYLSNNNQTRGYYINFSGMPANWETYGYVWAGVKVANETTEEIPSEGMSTIKLSGQVNASDFNIIKQILSTFKFVK